MMSDQPGIRRATATDVAAIAALTNAAYSKYVPLLGRKPQPMTIDYAQVVREHPVWLLEHDWHLCGLIVLQHEPECMLIYSVAIDPANQKRGFGRLLLALAEREAQQAGYSKIRLYTNALMERNIALYTRLGYQETNREPYLGGITVYMAKELPPAN